jgi:hypothetical protein
MKRILRYISESRKKIGTIIVKLVSISIIIGAFIFATYIKPELNFWHVMVPALFLVLIIIIDFSEISEVSVKGVKLETQKAKALNQAMKKDLEDFKEVNQSLLTYSIASIEKEGRFDMMTNPKHIVSFVDSSERLAKRIGVNEEFSELLIKAKCKAISAFAQQVQMQFPSIYEEAQKRISDGQYMDGREMRYLKRKVSVHFKSLYTLSAKLETYREQVEWDNFLKQFEDFYEKNFRYDGLDDIEL